jgi:hypothetical protein
MSETSATAPAFSALPVDAQIAALNTRLAALENGAPPVAAIPAPFAAELTTVAAGVARLTRHIFGE